MNWIYKGIEIKTLEDIPNEFKDYSGVIYSIETRGEKTRYYIGQKKLFKRTKRIIGKRELSKIKDKRKINRYKNRKKEWVYYEEVIKDNGFIAYCGSNEYLIEDIEKGIPYKKHILMFVKKESMLNYYEQRTQFDLKVLEQGDKFYNSNIGGRFYKRNIEIGMK